MVRAASSASPCGKPSVAELLGAWEANSGGHRTKLIGKWGLLHVRGRRWASDASLPAVEFDASLSARPWTGDADGGRCGQRPTANLGSVVLYHAVSIKFKLLECNIIEYAMYLYCYGIILAS